MPPEGIETFHEIMPPEQFVQTHKSLEFDPRVEPHPELEKQGILLNASAGIRWKFMEYMNP